ncbi:MAG TPA: tetratricopeptide repeat protein [Terriglobales bacterium]|nr:tetratricopeptide repeat protein [Terriglobales bacterium]
MSTAATTSKVTLDTSETLFSLLAAMNSCGYDTDLANSDPVRAKIREEIAQKAAASPDAAHAKAAFCTFYKDHQNPNPGLDLAQYVSLGLYLSEPPAFQPAIKEADMPPDATYVLGAVPLLQNFYQALGLRDLWKEHQGEYDALVERLHEPVSQMILKTDLYLKLQLSGYVGRRFTVFIEPLAAPRDINARNYGSDYFVVVSPAQGSIKLDQIRHTYLHYVLDPYAQKRGTTLKQLEPLLLAVSTAPMDESFKNDIGLLVNESLIRAIEARTLLVAGKDAEAARLQAAHAAVNEGFILTRYFYEALQKFEKDPVGLKDSYSEWLFQIDVGREKKLAQEVNFSKEAAPELLRASKAQQLQLLDLAEQRLAARDIPGAEKLAHQALDEKNEDPARALFILAKAASLSGDMDGARTYFERTLEIAREPRVVAWSHIYLGRIFDLQEEREAALAQYRAALSAGDTNPQTKDAADRGISQPYEPPPTRPKDQN